MSTPTTARGALLRRAGTLLVAAALVGAPASAALADPTPARPRRRQPHGIRHGDGHARREPVGRGEPHHRPVGTRRRRPPPARPRHRAPPPPHQPVAASPSPSASSSAAPPPHRRPSRTPPRPLSSPAPWPSGDDHYVYPGGTFLDGGNTIDGIIALSAVGHPAGPVRRLRGLPRGPPRRLRGLLRRGVCRPGRQGAPRRRHHRRRPHVVRRPRPRRRAPGPGDDARDASATTPPTATTPTPSASRSRSSPSPAPARGSTPRRCSCSSTGSAPTVDSAVTSTGAAPARATPTRPPSRPRPCSCGRHPRVRLGRRDPSRRRGRRCPAWARPARGRPGRVGWLRQRGRRLERQHHRRGRAGASLRRSHRGSRRRHRLHHDPPVRRLQPARPCAAGIAFSADTRSTTVPSDTDLRATPQAALALAGGSLVDTLAPGVEGAAPGTECPPAATREPIVVVTPTPTPSSSVDPTSTGAPTEAAGGSDPSTTVDASTTGALAQTGTDLLLPALLGLALVVIGGVAVFASTRRRGAHA